MWIGGFPAYPALHAQLHLKNRTGRPPILILAVFLSCTDRMAQVTPKHSTGRAPFFILALFGLATTEQLILRLKTGQDFRYFVFELFGPVPTARLILQIKTGQDARHFLFCFFVYGSLGSEVGCNCIAGAWLALKFFAYVAPKGVVLFDSNVRFK